MNHVLLVILALAAGLGGAWLLPQLVPGSTAGDTASDADTELLRERIADLERELQALKNPPESLRAAAPAPGTSAAAGGTEAVVEAVLAQLDERVDARVASKFESLAAEQSGEDDEPSGSFRARRKRVSLADAARELELSAQEEDELRRIYKDTTERMLKLAAGPNGDVEAVRRDLEAAQANPAAAQGLMMKYLPNLMGNVGQMLTITSEREAAVVKAVGPEKAQRLNRDFDIVEANPIGGGGLRIGASVQSGMPGR